MNNIRITFLRDEKYQPIGCIAIDVNPGNAILFYGVSVRNPLDRFDRKLARQIAIGRMVETPRKVQMPHNSGELSMHEITAVIMTDILKNQSNMPSRAVKAARLWFSSYPESNQPVIH